MKKTCIIEFLGIILTHTVFPLTHTVNPDICLSLHEIGNTVFVELTKRGVVGWRFKYSKNFVYHNKGSKFLIFKAHNFILLCYQHNHVISMVLDISQHEVSVHKPFAMGCKSQTKLSLNFKQNKKVKRKS